MRKSIETAIIYLLFAQAAFAATGTVNYNTVYQQLEGFGGAACYDVQTMASHPSREAVYDLLFRDLRLDVLRIKNTYEISSADITATGLIVAAGKSRNPSLKIELVPWSPAAYLKSDGYVGGPGHYNGTLKKDANDPNNSAPYYYVYKAYANWWLNSLIGTGGFFSVGVYPDYISMQNEPDWGIQDQECRFDATENSTYAGYDKAFEAIFNKMDGNVSPMPKMLAPETAGLVASQTYIDALNSIGQPDNIYGFSHHLYNVDYYYPDNGISAMQNYKTNYGYKPLFMTEYGADGTPTFTHALLLAQHIYNTLVYEGVTSYYHWTLFRDGSYATGGMVNLTPGGGYEVRDLYWFFKHYAYFTDPNWCRVKASTNSSNLRMTAFRNPDCNELTVVILNKSTSSESLTLTLNYFSPDEDVSEIYRSSSTEHWLYLGAFNPSGALMLPAQSITTIHLTGLQVFTPGTGYISRCKIRAGRIQAEDSFSASGTFSNFSPDIEDISQFDVNIISADGNLIYAETNNFDLCDVARGIFKYTYKIPRGADGAITLLKLDFNKWSFAIKAKNIDLTGLSCPLQLNITLGDYALSGDVNETVVNGSRRTIPTRLMRQYKDTLIVTRAKARHNNTTSLCDSLSVRGDIALANISDIDINEPNLVVEDVNITWGDHTFALLAGDFAAYRTGHRYRCRKIPSDANVGLITTNIDLDKCNFTISVKNADSIYAGPDDVNFGINFADFNETADVNMTTKRSY